MGRRIRTIKPEWLEDELLALASSDARVLSVALILLSDDHGRGRCNPIMLSGQVFPNKTFDVLTGALGELTAMRYVSVYEVENQSYFQIRNWSKHQRIDSAAPVSKFPDPLDTGTLDNSRPSRDPGPIHSIPIPSQISERKRKKETELPDNFSLSEKHLSHAAEKGWPAWWMALAHEHFCNYALSKGARFVDWDAALYNNCRAQINWGKGPKELAHLAPKAAQPNAAYEARQAAQEREIAAQTARARADLESRGVAVPGAGTVAIGNLLAKVGH